MTQAQAASFSLGFVGRIGTTAPEIINTISALVRAERLLEPQPLDGAVQPGIVE